MAEVYKRVWLRLEFNTERRRYFYFFVQLELTAKENQYNKNIEIKNDKKEVILYFAPAFESSFIKVIKDKFYRFCM